MPISDAPVSTAVEPVTFEKGDVLLDEGSLGKLVVHSHQASRSANVDGAQLTAHAQTGTARLEVEARGNRKLVCRWEPGPRFPTSGSIDLQVTVQTTVSHEAKTETADASATAACTLRSKILGEEFELDLTLPPHHVEAGTARFTSSRRRSFTATARAKLAGRKLKTGPLLASSRASLRVTADENAIASVELSVKTHWSFRITVQQTPA